MGERAMTAISFGEGDPGPSRTSIPRSFPKPAYNGPVAPARVSATGHDDCAEHWKVPGALAPVCVRPTYSWASGQPTVAAPPDRERSIRFAASLYGAAAERYGRPYDVEAVVSAAVNFEGAKTWRARERASAPRPVRPPAVSAGASRASATRSPTRTVRSATASRAAAGADMIPATTGRGAASIRPRSDSRRPCPLGCGRTFRARGSGLDWHVADGYCQKGAAA